MPNIEWRTGETLLQAAARIAQEIVDGGGGGGSRDDPLGLGFVVGYGGLPTTNSQTVAVANGGMAHKCIGGGDVDHIGFVVAHSAGNLDVGILRGAGGRTLPTTVVVSTGSFACPSNGFAAVSLGDVYTINPETDWLAISADSDTAQFAGYGALELGGFGKGLITRLNAGGPSFPLTSFVAQEVSQYGIALMAYKAS